MADSDGTVSVSGSEGAAQQFYAKTRKRKGKRSAVKAKTGGGSAYCVRCRAKRSMVGGRRAVTRKGQPYMTGTCATCGTKMCKFIAAK